MKKTVNIKEILNKIFWDKRLNIENHVITFIHRGAKEDKKTIPCKLIVKTGKSWFLYKNMEDETFIPYHRILEIKNIKTGEILWKKTGRT